MKFSIKLTAFLLAVMTLVPLTVAAGDSQLVSPAISVIAKDTSLRVTGMSYGNAVFSASDFDLTLGATVDEITILTLPDPDEGTLRLGDAPITVNQKIKRRHLSSLVFHPTDSDGAEATFYFTADGGYTTACEVSVIGTVNLAPTVNSESVSTSVLSGISTGVSVSASDPDGDEMTWFVTEFPKKGTLTLSASEDGLFVYTPDENKRGRDSFTVYARDEYGNWSEPVTVDIKIGKNKTGIEYSDLGGLAVYSDAVKMTAAGVMNGNTADGVTYFDPEKAVTREDFITMLMKTVGLDEIPEVAPVGFADDGEISNGARNYCRAAKKLGLVNGSTVDGELYFNPKSEITHAEAAVILNNLIGVDESVGEKAVSVFAEDSVVPVWARSAVGAMHTIGVMKLADGGASALSVLTRADVAKILAAVMDMVVE